MRFRKGDLVIVDVAGKPTQFEILNLLSSRAGRRTVLAEDPCYEARNTVTGGRSTISEDEILRMATPVDNSSDLFGKSSNEKSEEKG